ncbi:cytochrome c5 family protein [Chlorobaculum sp. 24CR]|jgi:cytochrome c5|uniref:c-type cytochrome n=1 Tax=Chlorobaculum sp. 24CR TaxID=2508878 RepID=UPI00100AD2B2|nr:c-type cytochrome [Chlorobaculum sp. 24CR]RXK87702.1 cytochrome c5 family protein [Chlorobaculum sp. 24CR]
MKRFLPLLATGLIVLGGCGLEKPPAELAKEIDEASKADQPKTEAAAPAAAPAPAATPLDPALAAGKEAYDASCAMCHDSGMMNAPKPGDKAAWEPRLAKGMDTVMKNTIEGLNGMPAKGGHPELTDEQLKGAVDYMIKDVK